MDGMIGIYPSNLNNENSLDVHLLKNLRIEGVPKSLKGTTYI